MTILLLGEIKVTGRDPPQNLPRIGFSAVSVGTKDCHSHLWVSIFKILTFDLGSGSGSDSGSGSRRIYKAAKFAKNPCKLTECWYKT